MAITINQTKGIIKVAYAWTSGTGGTATATTTENIAGIVNRIVTIPSATAEPTTLYDVTVKDELGVDICDGSCANRHKDNTEEVVPAIGTYFQRAIDDKLTFAVAAAGDTKAGQVIVYVKSS